MSYMYIHVLLKVPTRISSRSGDSHSVRNGGKEGGREEGISRTQQLL